MTRGSPPGAGLRPGSGPERFESPENRRAARPDQGRSSARLRLLLRTGDAAQRRFVGYCSAEDFGRLSIDASAGTAPRGDRSRWGALYARHARPPQAADAQARLPVVEDDGASDERRLAASRMASVSTS